jgi:hypothetical protein
LRAGEIGVFFRARGKDCAVFVEDDGAGSAGSDVDAENWNAASFLSKTCTRQFFRHPFDEGRIIFRIQAKKLR